MLAGMGERIEDISSAPTMAASSGTVAVSEAVSQPELVDLGCRSLEDVATGDRYRAERLLGKGGMGQVRLCRDERIGRHVAQKVIIRSGAAHPEMRARFLREARVQGQLEHPNIVPVYDLGIDPDGQLYFVMKRVRGRTFEQVLHGLAEGDAEMVRQFSRRKLLSTFVSVCLAVDFAHRRGVIHRDLKPANIMLGDFGEVYVLDWGLAKLVEVDDELQERPSLLPAPDALSTQVGRIYGTPGYMAPEQVAGGEIDVRADVYALGTILFEILTLEPWVVDPSSQLDGDLPEASASRRAPDRDIPPELDAICARAPAPSRDDRFASARALAETIDAYLDGDRDVALRRALAEQHAERAAAKARAVRDGQEEARTSALREVGRALALDPTNAAALRSLVDLLGTPPPELPSEAAAQLREHARQHARAASRGAVTIYLGSMIMYGLFVAWMGVREVVWAVVMLGAFGLAALVSQLDARGKGARLELVALALSVVAIFASSRMFGALVVVPTFVLGNTLGFALTPSRRRRFGYVAVGVLAFLAPAALERLGLLAPSYLFADGAITILPRMHDLPPEASWLAIVVITTISTVGAALFVGKVRDALARAERKIQLHSWQLGQMVAGEVTDREGDG